MDLRAARKPRIRQRKKAEERKAEEEAAEIAAAEASPVAQPDVDNAVRCPNPDCEGGEIAEEDNVTICTKCGSLINESNIVSEVTFGETAGGAAVVQGGYVGEGQTHARTLGPNFRGAGGTESREVSEGRGRDQIARLSNAIEPNLNDPIRTQAFNIYRLLLNSNFVQGRQVSDVAAACLYLACRRSKDNQVLLMDFSEILQVSVYKLGRYYNDIKKELCIENFDNVGIAPVVQPERLIYKFARRMEFKDKLMKVCEDASKLMRRMKRDWMVTGRSPAGLCGACLILAARMNNFRRSVRETVFIVRVTSLTVTKRLEEFKRTKASELSVQDFRTHGHLLKDTAEPPVLYDLRTKMKHKRQDAEPHASTARIDADGFAIPALPTHSPTHSRESSHSSPAPESQREQTDPADEVASPSQESRKRKRAGRPPKPKEPKVAKTPITLTEEDLLEEELLEEEISSVINDPTVLESMDDAAHAVFEERAKEIAASERRKDQLLRRQISATLNGPVPTAEDLNEVTAHQTNTPPPSQPSPSSPEPLAKRTLDSEASSAGLLPLTPLASQSQNPTLSNDANLDAVENERRMQWDNPEILTTEFADDPEVRYCVLSEHEQKIKERIWVTHNEDWLRAQQAKLLKKTLEEANGDGHSRSASSRGRGGRRKRARMGDGSLLRGESVSSPAEAAQKMLEKHAKGYSKHIDYDRLNAIYRGIMGKSSTATTVATTSEWAGLSRGGSQAGTSREGSVAASEVSGGGAASPEEPPAKTKQKKKASAAAAVSPETTAATTMTTRTKRARKSSRKGAKLDSVREEEGESESEQQQQQHQQNKQREQQAEAGAQEDDEEYDPAADGEDEYEESRVEARTRHELDELGVDEEDMAYDEGDVYDEEAAVGLDDEFDDY